MLVGFKPRFEDFFEELWVSIGYLQGHNFDFTTYKNMDLSHKKPNNKFVETGLETWAFANWGIAC